MRTTFTLVTRKIAQSAKFSAVLALLVLMVMGMDQAFAENQAQIDLHEFGELLDGVATQILATTVQLQPEQDNTTPTAESLVAQITHLEAFDEVIKSNHL